MTWNTVSAMMAMAPASQPGQEAPPFYVQMFPLILMVVIFYFILIRPQQKKAKEHQNLLNTLKTGDKILTNGGIIATVISVKDKTVSVRSADSKFEILKSAVTEITERGGESKDVQS
jgi:preprotein translocase subunit YajC